MNEQQYTIGLNKCTGLLIYGSYRTFQKTGTYEELKKAYQSVQRHNKWLGWWFGLLPFTNYRFIKTNKANMAELDQIHNSELAKPSGSMASPTDTPTPMPPAATPGVALNPVQTPESTSGTPPPLTPPTGPPQKKSKKKVVLIVVGVVVGLIVLLALIPTPPEEPKKEASQSQGPERPQPADTKIQRYADHKFEIAIPNSWEEETETELQNSEGESSKDELKKLDFHKLFVDYSYLDSEESPTVYIEADKHNYVSDDTALRRHKDLDNELSNQNGHKVTVTKEEVKVGKHGKYKGYLYTYVDTFDKDTVEKIKAYRLYTAANGYNYFVAGFSSTNPAAAKYDSIVKQSVLSLNPDE